MSIGATTRSTGAFTTLAANDTTTLTGGLSATGADKDYSFQPTGSGTVTLSPQGTGNVVINPVTPKVLLKVAEVPLKVPIVEIPRIVEPKVLVNPPVPILVINGLRVLPSIWVTSSAPSRPPMMPGISKRKNNFLSTLPNFA